MILNNKSKKKKKIWVLLIVTIVVIFALFVVPPRLKKNVKNAYKTEEIKTRDISSFYNFSGVVEVKEREMIMAKDNDQVTEIYFEEGDTVKKGDELLKLKRGEVIEASIDGEITKIFVEKDSRIMAGSKIIDLVNYDDLRIGIKVDEYDLKSITEGQEVEVEIHSIDKKIKGRIEDISREAMNTNGVAFFTAAIDIDKDQEIRVGMNAEAKILNEMVENAVAVAMEALQFNDDNTVYVFVPDKDGLPVRRDLKVGISDGMYVQVMEGLKSGEKILVPIKSSNKMTRPPFARGNNNE